MQSEFDRDREGLMRHLNQLADAVERHGIPVDGFDDRSRPAGSKMQQLNGSFQDSGFSG
eukprot:CAMPEP_0183573334 /NCGR_PEP_ID=MMETSP0371-20130417/130737_1 /TAXON_ID=268820 /ORGANISM="Peridinium aciculiferum, Strain PAER-2" /LENGTH=58 /DNA_ID=CAMNT_0025783293 /DNA_START=1 /DNA_END=174 /DNA_ORIENTATION=-